MHLWKELVANLDSVANTTQRKTIQKRYDLAMTPSHFLCYLLMPKYFGQAKSVLKPKEIEQVYPFLQSQYGDVGVEFFNKIIQLGGKATPFDGPLMSEKIIKSLTATQWWRAIQDTKRLLSEKEEYIIHQHLTARATSASIKRTFSTFEFLNSNVRNRLETEKTAKLFFLYKHLNE